MRIRCLVVTAAVAAATLCAAPAARADRAFTPRFTTNDTGDIAFASAPLMTCSTTGVGGGSCAASRLLSAADGPAGNTTIDAQNNNSYTMVYVDRDNDPATRFNSSTALLDIPAGSTVLFAGLYWGSKDTAGNNGGANPDPALIRNQVKFKVPGGTYSTLTASALDVGTGNSTARYQGFANVTAAVRAAGAGTYAVGDVRAATGGDQYAGWTLVVAFRDTAQPARNLTVFDGFKTIAPNSAPTTIPVSGFQTPPAGPVRTRLGFVSYEGDLGLGGDTATLNATTLGNAANGPTNFFNSSISRAGAAVATRDPNYPNAMGYDADLFDANGILANGATNATIGLTTSADQYLPGVLTFATELYAPAVALVKSVANVTHPGGPDQRGDVLRYTVTARNTGQDGADDFVLSDPIPAGATYVAGSLRIAGATVTDQAADDRGEYSAANHLVRLRIGTGANALSGGRLAAGAAIPISFDVRIGTLPARTEIVNAASATFVTQSLGIALNADSNEVRTVVAAPNLTLAKSHAPAFVAGSRSTFSIVASNLGNLPTDGTTVTVGDTFPAGAFSSLANAGGVGWNCGLAGLTLTCTRSDVLAAGASYPPIVIDAVVADPAPASIVNTAVVSGGGDSDPTDNSATDVGGTAQQADVSITKSAAPGSVLSGATVTYTLIASNAGPSVARGVTVDDPLGAEYANVTATPTRGTCTTAVSCTLGDLAPGESATVTVTATVVAHDVTLTNVATVGAATPDPTPANNTASAQVVVLPTADLRLSKTPSTPTPVAGAPNGLTYTLVATNNGPDAATGVVLRDDIPADFSPTSVTAPGGFVCDAPAAGGTLTCSGGTIAAGASATFTVVGTVAAAPNAILLRNTAAVRADTQDPDPSDNDASAVVQAVPAADLGVTKEWGSAADPFTPIASIAPDRDVRIRLTLENHGPSPATQVLLRDALPANVVYVSDDQAACTAAAGVVTCTVGALPVGGTFVVLVTVHLQPAAAGTTITNTATKAALQDDPVGANDVGSDDLVVGLAADLALSKTASPLAASVGQAVTYTLVVTNNGPSPATQVAVTDPLPAGVAFVSSPDCANAGGTLTCAVGTLAAGATATVTFVGRPGLATAGTTVTNTATVASATPDPEPANNVAGAAVVVAPLTDLQIAKTASTASTLPGQVVTYTLTARNLGPNDATGVSIVDAVGAGMTFVDAPGCAFSAAARTVTCDVGALASGASAAFTVALQPDLTLAGTTATNVARVSGAEADPDPANNRDDATVAVLPQADLRIVKTANATTVVSGGALTYTLAVSNDGPSPATAVEVQDTLPAGVVALSATPAQGTCTIAGARVTCALGTVAAGATTAVDVVVTVTAAAGATLDNAATVASPVDDPRPQDNTATTSTSVTTVALVPNPTTGGAAPAQLAPDLTVTKTVDRTRATTADRLTYTITVSNTGTGPAGQVVVADTFSRGVALFSVRTTAGTCTRAPLSCRIDGLAAGARVVITVVARATTAGTLGNRANVTSPGLPAAAAAAAPVTVTLPRATLSLRKRASATRVAAGGVVSFALTVRNTSRNPAVRVRVCDTLPSGLTFVSASGAKVSGAGACWTIARLAAGRSRTFTVRARGDRGPRARTVTNTATATSTNATTARASAGVSIDPAPGRGGGVTG